LSTDLFFLFFLATSQFLGPGRKEVSRIIMRHCFFYGVGREMPNKIPFLCLPFSPATEEKFPSEPTPLPPMLIRLPRPCSRAEMASARPGWGRRKIGAAKIQREEALLSFPHFESAKPNLIQASLFRGVKNNEKEN